MGHWSKEDEERNGTYYPNGGGSREAILDWSPQQVYDDLVGSVVCPGEKVSVLPSQKKLAVWRSSKGSDPKPRRMSVDGRVSVGLERTVDRIRMIEGDHGDVYELNRRDLNDDLMGLELDDGSRRSSVQQLKIPKSVKKQGETIYKGHKNYELMLNLQLGIRLGIPKIYTTLVRGVKI